MRSRHGGEDRWGQGRQPQGGDDAAANIEGAAAAAAAAEAVVQAVTAVRVEDPGRGAVKEENEVSPEWRRDFP